jgi:hypothetical protein
MTMRQTRGDRLLEACLLEVLTGPDAHLASHVAPDDVSSSSASGRLGYSVG